MTEILTFATHCLDFEITESTNFDFTFSSATFANRSRNLSHIEKWQILNVRKCYVILYTNRIKWQFYQICNQTILLNDYVLIDRYVQFSQ